MQALICYQYHRVTLEDGEKVLATLRIWLHIWIWQTQRWMHEQDLFMETKAEQASGKWSWHLVYRAVMLGEWVQILYQSTDMSQENKCYWTEYSHFWVTASLLLILECENAPPCLGGKTPFDIKLLMECAQTWPLYLVTFFYNNPIFIWQKTANSLWFLLTPSFNFCWCHCFVLFQKSDSDHFLTLL